MEKKGHQILDKGRAIWYEINNSYLLVNETVKKVETALSASKAMSAFFLIDFGQIRFE
jgi:hypothetical protein